MRPMRSEVQGETCGGIAKHRLEQRESVTSRIFSPPCGHRTRQESPAARQRSGSVCAHGKPQNSGASSSSSSRIGEALDPCKGSASPYLIVNSGTHLVSDAFGWTSCRGDRERLAARYGGRPFVMCPAEPPQVTSSRKSHRKNGLCRDTHQKVGTLKEHINPIS